MPGRTSYKRASVGLPRTDDLRDAQPRFVVYRPPGDESSRSIVELLEDRQGTIWCGTGGRLYRLAKTVRGMSFNFLDLGLPRGLGLVTALVEDSQGALWVGTLRGLYRCLPDGSIERYGTGQGLPTDVIYSLLKDREGRLWVGTAHGLCLLVPRHDPNRPVVARLYTTRDGLPSGDAQVLFQASDGRMWVSGGRHLSEFIPGDAQNGRRFRSYKIFANSLADDREGNLWAGSSMGVRRLARNGFARHGVEDGLHAGFVQAIFEDRAGELCVALEIRVVSTMG